MVCNDPRLTDQIIFALAALRAQKRQTTAPVEMVKLRIIYVDTSGREPDELGETYLYPVPTGRGAGQ